MLINTTLIAASTSKFSITRWSGFTYFPLYGSYHRVLGWAGRSIYSPYFSTQIICPVWDRTHGLSCTGCVSIDYTYFEIPTYCIPRNLSNSCGHKPTAGNRHILTSVEITLSHSLSWHLFIHTLSTFMLLIFKNVSLVYTLSGTSSWEVIVTLGLTACANVFVYFVFRNTSTAAHFWKPLIRLFKWISLSNPKYICAYGCFGDRQFRFHVSFLLRQVYIVFRVLHLSFVVWVRRNPSAYQRIKHFSYSSVP